MIWALISLALAVIALAGAVGCVLRVVWLSKADHAKCIAHIASVTSSRVVATAFREAAYHYESVEGQAELARIRNTVYKGSAGATVPALWLRERADKIEVQP